MLDVSTINWLEEQDDWSFNVNEDYFSWEKDGKYYYYDDNGCWETSELNDVKKFTVKDGEAFYGNETVKELFDRVILDEVDVNFDD
jgi:hypothetical protein